MRDPSTHRAFQLSYLRALVTLLVVAHHTALAYVTFIPPRSGFTAALLWTAFPIADARRWSGFDVLVGWNDIFFMALMFFVSGLFVWPGLQRHGAGTFVRRRFLRLGVPFVVAAGLLAPLAYYPAYLQLGGSPYLGGYASAWLTLGKWPAGPAWFLWVLLMFDCVAALFFMALPQAVEALARGVRTASNRPLLLFLMLAALSFAAYVPMATQFGGQTWWSWGPFFVQSSRVLHYFVYFAMGVCLGAFGTEIPIFERTGVVVEPGNGCCVPGSNGTRADWEIRRSEDGVSGFLRGVEPLSGGGCDPLGAALALGRQPERKCVWNLSSALPICHLDSVRGASLDSAGNCQGCRGVGCCDWTELDGGRAVETEQGIWSSGLNRELALSV
jgi:hypothetical protein